MHIVVSWDISVNGDKWKEINDALKSCLKGYSWVKPLRTLYIVQVQTVDERKTIKNSMIEVCKKYSAEIDLVISPVMEGGNYAGWLPKELWTKIKARVGGAA